MIFLTVGTLFPFDRLVKSVDNAVAEGLIKQKVFAQIGKTSFKPRNMQYVEVLDKKSFDEKVADADYLVGHAGIVNDECVRLPVVRTERHIFNQYVIRVPRRDELKESLQEASIGTEIYYPVPMHLQECFSYLGYKPGDLPESEKAAQETLALPVYPEVGDEQAEYVIKCIADFY